MCFFGVKRPKECGSCLNLVSTAKLARFVVILWSVWRNRNAALYGGFELGRLFEFCCDIVSAASKLFPSYFSVELGEFLALKEGLVLAKSLDLFIIDDIKEICKEVGNCRCLAIPRSGNRLAHVLASIAFSSGVNQSWSHVANDCFFAM
ncbi:hypothetical protein JRO89_XS01G0299300 [Xanthoceras sorbifolium]|uniref:RNase H type-1 domain-containing protein n=1 Tax=Xanthoceras sorbifolium TaxID=99658 RepID=A0ABQ8IM59_9ROSI|nr:hypothetical protein JRO89_XS01G0299300 [Xanthoceras sorbifolium]